MSVFNITNGRLIIARFSVLLYIKYWQKKINNNNNNLNRFEDTDVKVLGHKVKRTTSG